LQGRTRTRTLTTQSSMRTPMVPTYTIATIIRVRPPAL
jgi:hypothetical protein